MQIYANGPMPGHRVRVVQTGEVGRVRAIDREWADLYPHKGPMLILDIRDPRKCYSLIELEPIQEEPV
jgi:hypothetical protein